MTEKEVGEMRPSIIVVVLVLAIAIPIIGGKALYRAGYEAAEAQQAADKIEHDRFMQSIGVCEWTLRWAEYNSCPRAEMLDEGE